MSQETAQREAEKQGPSAVVRYWTAEIEAARKREKDWRKEGERIRSIYDGSQKKKVPFNILYSNTETLLPALYGSTPIPIVQRRFKDNDPVGRASAMVGQRTLDFLIDTNLEGYEPFNNAVRDATLDALLPGRGVTRAKYEADVQGVPTGDMDEAGEAVLQEVKTFETVCTESVGWNRVYFGYAKKWSRVPWIAFEHYMDRAEAIEKFGEQIAAKMVFTVNDEDQDKKEQGDKSDQKVEGDPSTERRTCLVYEIWKKKGKKVCFFAPTYVEGYLSERDDELELSGFYPIPEPLRFLRKTDDLSPSALYSLYENQATELNRITTRINKIVEAIKVRGAYDGSLGDTLENLLKADDNTMYPANAVSEIALQGGLEKYIWFMPLEMLVAVVKQLYIARDQCKMVIYEITGLSDIIRGASVASETATAQNIKNQWGSLRIRMLQNEVRRYVRDVLRIMLEIAGKKFSPETFARMTGMQFPTAMQKQQAQMILAAQQQAGQQPDPQAQQIMSQPSWEEIVALLKDDIDRSYRIDIETNSTVQLNEEEDKQNIAEALSAFGNYIKGVGPLVEQGIMPFEAAQSMLLAIVRKYRFGTEIEEQIKQMRPPAPKADPAQDVAKIKALAEANRTQGEVAIERQRAQMEAEKMAREAEYAREEHAMKMAELQAQKEYNLMMAQIKMAEAQAKAAGVMQ